MKKRILFRTVAVLAACVMSCKKEENKPDSHVNTIVLPAGGDAVVQANNAFAFNFLHATLQQDAANNNKLISPLSIYLALSMAYNGANKATKDSIAYALQASGMDINTLNEVCSALITQLPGEDSRVAVSIANSIWYNQKNYQPLPSFLTTVQDSYKATLQASDFTNPATVNTINKWAADQTHNKITEILDKVSSSDLMYLINAIYFKGSWHTKFSASATHNADFYTGSSTVSVPFMSGKFTTNLYKGSLFTLLELPYGGSNGYSMYIALPAEGTTANTLAGNLTEATLSSAIHSMDSSEVDITIPKWEYSYQIDDMYPELSLLGMANAFTDTADFSKMYNSSEVKPYITKSIHKTYIKVDEEGTEAAAVTVIGMGTTSVNLYPFIADRPFLYFIAEKQTGTLLFTGILNTPATE